MPAPNTEHADDQEALDMYTNFKKVNPTAKITLDQFKQVLLMRRKELAAIISPKDTSHIPIDEKVLERNNDELDSAAHREAVKITERSSRRTAERDKEMSRMFAQLHSYLPPEKQQQLTSSYRGALGSSPPTLPMPAFANVVIELCKDYAPDADEGLDMEIGFREYFAEALSMPVDAFDKGGMPRKIFAHLMAKRRRQEKELREKGIGDDDANISKMPGSKLEMLKEEEEMNCVAPSTGFGGCKGDYMREKIMQIPEEKREKMLRGMLP